MATPSRSEILKSKPIDNGLNNIRDLFKSRCKELEISASAQALDQIANEDIQNLSLALVSVLQILPAAHLLPSKTGIKNLFNHLSKLNTAISSDEFDIERIRPLWNVVLKREPDDVIWNQVEAAITESIPPPRPPLSFQQSPLSINTGSFANSTEHRKHADNVLKDELGQMHVDVPGFYEAFFGGIAGPDSAAQAVFDKCKEGDDPLREESGWRGWPQEAKERDVLSWYAPLIGQLLDFSEKHQPPRSVFNRQGTIIQSLAKPASSWTQLQTKFAPHGRQGSKCPTAILSIAPIN